MNCVYCKQEVLFAQYCGMCDWNQLVSPKAFTLRAIHDRWMPRRYMKIGIKTKPDYDNAQNKLKLLRDVPASEIGVDNLQDILDYGRGDSVRAQVKVRLMSLPDWPILFSRETAFP